MKLLGTIEFDEDLVNKKYVDDAIGDNAEVFVAIYEQTTYADVTAAIDANKVIMLDMPANHNLFNITHATYTNGGNAIMYAIFKMNNRSTLMTATLTPAGIWTVVHTDLQDKLVSGTNIKTINNESLLGAGNINIGSGGEAIGVIRPWISAMDCDQAYEILQNHNLCVLEYSQYLYPILRWAYTGGNQPKVTIWCSINPGLGIVKIFTCTKGAGTGGTDSWSNSDAFQAQAKLTSGTNIKTINNQSLLGSGNLNIGGGTIDTAMSDTSENAVQNKVIKSYVDGKAGVNMAVGKETWYGTYTDENNVTYQVYTKTVYIPALPATAGITTYSHGVSNIKQILSIYGFTTDGFVLNAPRQVASDNITIYQASKSSSNQTFSIEVGKDRSSKKAYVTMIYAKNN